MEHIIEKKGLIVVDDIFLNQLVYCLHRNDFIRVYFSFAIQNHICLIGHLLQLLAIFDVAGQLSVANRHMVIVSPSLED